MRTSPPAPGGMAVATGAAVTMTTVSGRSVALLAPRPEDIDLRDIAHHLSLLCRWVGGVNAFYSVAQHSVHVAAVVSPEHRLWALLHDASEAYLGDVSARLKGWVGMGPYRAVEGHLQRVIYQKFGLAGDCPEEVGAADHLLLVSEAQDLMDTPPADWPEVWRTPRERAPFPIKPWSPARARANFLRAFTRITNQAVAP